MGGLRYAFDPASRPATSRLVAAQLLANGSATPLPAFSGSIMLLTNDYVAGGGDFYDMLAPAPVVYDSSTPLDTILSQYFADLSPLNVTVDGRIVNCAAAPSDALCTVSGASVGGSEAAAAPAPAPTQRRRAARRLAAAR